MDSSKPSTKAIVGLVAAVLLVIAATGAVIALSGQGSKTSTSDNATTTSTTNTSSSKASNATSFKDGTYNATGSYSTPGGTESIAVSVTLNGGTITDATVTQEAKSSEAHEFQADFVSGYKSQVVGKKISDVNLSRVSGSSLTPIGFNSALDQIKSEAAA